MAAESARPRFLRRHGELLLSTLAFLAIGVLLHPVVIRGGFVWDEAFVEYFAWRFEAVRLVHAGEWPFFTDRLFAGIPLMSTAYVGVFYPPNWLYLIGTPELFNWMFVLHTVAGGLGMRAYLRTWRLAPVAVFAGAVFFVCGTFHVNHVGHVSMREAALLAPWVAWAARRVLRAPSARRGAVLALVLGLQVAAGYMQVVLFTVGWIFFEWLGALRVRMDFARATGWLAVGGLLGVGLLGAMILPTLAHSAQTPRAGMALEHWQYSSFPPSHAILFLQPLAHGWPGRIWTGFPEFPIELLITVSPAAWALAFAATMLALRGRGPRRRGTLVFAVGVVVAFLLANGSFLPANAWLFHVPPFNMFRVPCRWLFLATTLASVLAAFGVHALVGRRLAQRVVLLAGGWLALAIVAVGLFLVFRHIGVDPPLRELLLGGTPQRWVLGTTALAGAALLLVRRLPGVTAAALLLVVLLEAVPYQRNVVLPPDSFAFELGRASHPVHDAFPAHATPRLFALYPGHGWPLPIMLPPNTNVFRRHASLGGYTPLLSARFERLMRIGQIGRAWEEEELLANPAVLHAGAVSHVLVATGRLDERQLALLERFAAEHADLVAQDPAFVVLRFRQPTPRVHFAAAWKPVEEIDEMFAALREMHPAQTERTLPIFTADLPEGFPLPAGVPLARGHVDPWMMQSGRQLIRAEADGPSLLVVRDSYWKGWKWRVTNGTAADRVWREVVPVQGLWRGVPLTAGAWDVELRYFPPGWPAGKATSALCLLLTLVLFFRGGTGLSDRRPGSSR